MSEEESGSGGKKAVDEVEVTSEEVLSMFKRRGLFDNTRKDLFNEFTSSESYNALLEAIEEQIKSDSAATSLAARSRGKAAALLEGSVTRSEAFSNVNKYVDDRVSTNNEELNERLEKLVTEIYTALVESKSGSNGDASGAKTTSTEIKEEKELK
ncbi:hypothetical protein BZA70DRAFT_268120 [Myxozyma melibiosi]|uniref:BOD1/SHG1 domain-containing protein n=1 Tax=Myxozyma melibiosi TaxID=54550 RepID=A0ABR1F338_9ASCO